MLKFNDQQFGSALLPIKPIYVDKILSGEKKVEFRKSEFKRPISKLVIYSSSPTKMVVAVCDIKKIRIKSPAQTWLKYKNVAGISQKDFFSYYKNKEQAVSIELLNVRVLSKPISISTVTNSTNVPQSYQYLSKEQTEAIERLPISNIV